VSASCATETSSDEPIASAISAARSASRLARGRSSAIGSRQRPRPPRAADEQGGGREVHAVLPRLGQPAVDEIVGVGLPLAAHERPGIAAAQQGGVAAQARRGLRVGERACELDRLEIGVERLVSVHGRVVAVRAQLEGRQALGGPLGERQRAVGEAQRLGEREPAAGGLAGLDQRPDRRGAQLLALRRAFGPCERGIGRLRRGLVVVGEEVEVLVAAVAGERLEPGGDGGVHPAARTTRDRAIGHLAREPVDEGQLALSGQRRRGPRHDEAAPLQRAQDRRERLLPPPRLERAGPEPPAHHRGVLEDVLLGLGQRIDARGEQRTDGGRDLGLVAAAALEVTHDLLGIERVALGHVDHALGEQRVRAGEHPGDQVARGACIERLERHLPGPRPLTPARARPRQLGARGRHHQQRPLRARKDRLDHVEQRGLGPVQVLDRDDGRRARGERAEEARPGEADLLGDRLRGRVAQRAVHQRQARAGRQRRRDPQDLRRVRRLGCQQLAHEARQLVGRREAAVVEQHAGGVPQDLAQRPVGDALPVGQAAPAVHGAAGLERHSRAQLLEQPALADPRLADDGDQMRAPLRERGAVQLAQQGQLAVAADEARRPRRRRRLTGGAPRRRGPGDRLEAQRVGRHRARGGIDRGGAGRCGALERGRGARHGARRTPALAAAERDDRLAGGDAGAGGEAQLADPQRGAHRSLGIVLVRDRRAEHRHQRPGPQLVRGGAEALDRRARTPLGLGLDRPQLLGVQRGGGLGQLRT
jgi:hypothetical protein